MKRILLPLILLLIFAIDAHALVLLKKDTAVAILMGPFVDATDGVTPETDLSSVLDLDDIRLSKQAGNFAPKNAGLTMFHDENGYYTFLIDGTDTNTLGQLRIAIHAPGALPVWQDFMVVPANVYDSLVGGEKLQVDVTHIDGDDAEAFAGPFDVNVTELVGAAQSAADLKDFADQGYDPTTNRITGGPSLLVDGTVHADGHTTTVVVISGAVSSTNDAYVGMTAELRAGNDYSARSIVDYDAGDGEITVSPAFAFDPDPGDSIRIFRKVP